MNDSNKNENDFFKVVTIATCISFAILGAILSSVRRVGTGFGFQFSWLTLIGIFGGIFAGWLLWRIFRSLAEKDKR